jgi:hypothetical protein
VELDDNQTESPTKHSRLSPHMLPRESERSALGVEDDTIVEGRQKAAGTEAVYRERTQDSLCPDSQDVRPSESRPNHAPHQPGSPQDASGKPEINKLLTESQAQTRAWRDPGGLSESLEQIALSIEREERSGARASYFSAPPETRFECR